MKCHRNFFGMPKKSLWNYTEISLDLYWNFSVEFSLKFQRIIPLKFQRNFSVIPMKIFRRVTTSTICCKKISLNSDFIHIFSCFSTCIYSPGAGAYNPLWTKFWCHQKGLVTLPICCRFKKNIFEVWFYTYFCLFLYMYIALGHVRECPGVRILILT